MEVCFFFGPAPMRMTSIGPDQSAPERRLTVLVVEDDFLIAMDLETTLERRGWRRQAVFPHGGNQMTLHIVGGFGLGGCEAYPDVFGAFAGFADEAKVESGWLKLPDRPGIGFEAQNDLYALMKSIA